MAYGAALWMETHARDNVTATLRAAGYDWAEASVDGLVLTLSGTAPTEAIRFRALTAAGEIVDPSRVIDKMTVVPAEDAAPPAFSVEMLRNANGVSLIGLVPAVTDREQIAARLGGQDGIGAITDLLETADYPAPENWDTALDFGLTAIETLARSKVSVAHNRVAITAIADSDRERRLLETDLARAAPPAISLALSIAAPRPVITPFTVRFIRNETGARFDACAAGSEAARDTIVSAAIAAGMQGKVTCEIALGSPSPDWAEAVATGLNALADIGAGTVTLADGDVTLVADPATDPATFDRTIGALENTLPDGFALTALLPKAEDADTPDDGTTPAFFTAVLDEDGKVDLTGRLPNAEVRDAVESYAAARFGADNITPAARLAEDMPTGWPVRVLAGLEALAILNHGKVDIRADTLSVTGVTGEVDAPGFITRILAAKLGSGADYRIDVRYEEELDPLAALLEPEDCVSRINEALQDRKITFAPGSGDIESESLATVEMIATIMELCAHVPMEVAGHTDSQGRESMNQELSRLRAAAVVTALQARRVLTGNLTIRGYGETNPIADNGTDAGREANRRIEFTLVDPEAVAETEDAPPEESEDEPN